MSRNSSAHVIIDRDRPAWQIANFNRRAWHAGPSKYGSVKDLNTHSVSLEFVNAGYMKSDGAGAWVDSSGRRMPEQQLNDAGGFILAPHPIVGSTTYAWLAYTPDQIETGRQIPMVLIAKYDTQDIITHEEVDNRGWRTDPGPAFSQPMFKDLLGLGFDIDQPTPRYRVIAARLNFRGSPNGDAEKIDPPDFLPEGTMVEFIQRSGDWAFVTVSGVPQSADMPEVGMKGWVHSDYVERVF